MLENLPQLLLNEEDYLSINAAPTLLTTETILLKEKICIRAPLPVTDKRFQIKRV